MTHCKTRLLALLALFSALLLTACTGMAPGYQAPQVSITSFGLAPESTGSAPGFSIGIRVVNPNREALHLYGMSYDIEIDGNRVLTGAKPDLPEVKGYDTADFVIIANPDLLGGIRLLADLFAQRTNKLSYTFHARIDAGGLLPLNVTESGEFGLPSGK